MVRLCYFLCFFLVVWQSQAGGPLSISNGEEVKWRDTGSAILFRLDQGRLGPLSNFRANAVMTNAFLKWNRVANSTIKLDRSSRSLPSDVTSSNYNQIINSLSQDTNAIIYDDDGGIIELKMGSGAREHVLGLATTYSRGSEIVRGEAIFNGYFFEDHNLSEDEILSTILHEVGHLCGLDHTQHSRHLANNRIDTDDHYVSTMYPTSTDNDGLRKELSFDDQLAISNLYPNLYHRNSTGAIQGVVKRGSRELPGVNVIARDVNDPFRRIATTVTGTYELNRGTYELKGLPPGNYELMIEAIDSRFTGTSSVGQYSERSGDQSFRSPPKPMYYDDDNGGRSTASFINVKKFNTVSNIEFLVDSESLPENEANVRMLAINSQAKNGAPAGYYSSFPFLLHPAGNEGHISIEVEFDTRASYVIDVGRERANGTKEEHSVRGEGESEIIILGDGGDLPLESTRYFISIGNTGSKNFTYTVKVEAGEAPVITPTDTPTPTSTPTPTPTPTRTTQPRPTPTFKPYPTLPPTSTPTNTPTLTPTPVEPVKGDVNGDSRVETEDALLVLQMTVGLPIEPSNELTLEEMREAADVNNDGEIRVDDAILILQMVEDQ